MALGSTQPLTEMSTRNLLGGGGGGEGAVGRRVRRLTKKPSMNRLPREFANHNPTRLHGLLQG
jgi:hypothetical protein